MSAMFSYAMECKGRSLDHLASSYNLTRQLGEIDASLRLRVARELGWVEIKGVEE